MNHLFDGRRKVEITIFDNIIKFEKVYTIEREFLRSDIILKRYPEHLKGLEKQNRNFIGQELMKFPDDVLSGLVIGIRTNEKRDVSSKIEFKRIKTSLYLYRKEIF